MRRFVNVVAMCLLAAPAGWAQTRFLYSEQCDARFREAVAVYDAGQYADAAVRFDRLLADFPSGHRVTAAMVMKGKALLRSGQNLEAARTARAFLSRYPESRYLPDVELTLGIVYRRIDRHVEALDNLLAAFRALPPAAPQRLSRDILAQLDSTVDEHLDREALRSLLSRSTSARERAFLWMKIAEKESGLENAVGAGIALDSLTSGYPSAQYHERIAMLRGRVAARSAVKIGVLLPLMTNGDPSAVKDVGNEVFDGILYAVDAYGRDENLRVAVSVVSRDTKRDAAEAKKGAEELCADRDVVGILGPVFSTTVQSAAAVANMRSVPLISPTANGNGLAGIGSYIFQANPDYEMRGRAMARYAVERKGYRSLAVLAPSDAYGKFLAEGFLREAIRLGAKIVSAQWYDHGASDLKQQLAEIRKKGMLAGAEPRIPFGGRMKQTSILKLSNYGIPLKRIDSLMRVGSTVSGRWLLGDHAREVLDSLAIPVTYDESRVDSLEYPVESIDAIYIPIGKAEEIGMVSSQVVYYNLKTQILGSGEWNSLSELNANRRYADGVIFDSDTHVDTTGGRYDRFVAGFAARFKHRPSKNALFGYDAAGVMLDCLRKGATTREALQRALAGVTAYQGEHAKIGFLSGRVNCWLSIMQFSGDEVRHIEELCAGGSPAGEGNARGGTE
jgi:ABC-type branched-subunit amino acid transport system substrate-binding protein